ncbi:NAD(P)H-dependent FMN reductase LOT6, putative [Talaromyces stipitatus ATCC 10500]|uniref:NAD(P)H-dependent FMN reductase LOT6, putative n=1 Tax=Talaromyces stipitatus (strain ATCC 10500 / CBS 375.48 / QM 6759 / NRRL 1006) TaxID=441959 RepID=B8MGN3_TALSN|nr:NAD(P)H-dependent FMN reductase LOT6, putative [Talaromyces stipitatus ATCC 10500]EED16784.1 NAD(P)H-dependent FMN reductase LOT6, putative [Talaromyces stipitatus ATCC 10500]
MRKAPSDCAADPAADPAFTKHGLYQPILSNKMSPLQIALILGSTRPNRISPLVGNWVKTILESSGTSSPQFSILTVDIQTFDLPAFNESVHPALINDLSKFTSQSARNWNHEIAKYDAYIIISPEYHAAIPGSLKNALDFLYHAWTGKPAMIVTYGIMGGTSASEGLRVILENGFKMKVSSFAPRLEFPGRDPTKNNSSQALIEAMQGKLSVETMKFWEGKKQEIFQGFKEVLEFVAK